MIYTSVNASLASQDLSLISMNVFVRDDWRTFVIGIIIGSLGSVISMNRYLKFNRQATCKRSAQ